MTCWSPKSIRCLGEVWGAKGNLDWEEELEKEVPGGQKKPTLHMPVGQLWGLPSSSALKHIPSNHRAVKNGFYFGVRAGLEADLVIRFCFFFF